MSAWEEERKRESKEENLVFDLVIAYLLRRLTRREGSTKQEGLSNTICFRLGDSLGLEPKRRWWLNIFLSYSLSITKVRVTQLFCSGKLFKCHVSERRLDPVNHFCPQFCPDSTNWKWGRESRWLTSIHNTLLNHYSKFEKCSGYYFFVLDLVCGLFTFIYICGQQWE